MSKRLATTILLGALVGGCNLTPWPEYRGGGVAEVVPARTGGFFTPASTVRADQLYDQLALLEMGLETLVSRGAYEYARAETTLAQKLIVRIRRELAGDLLVAAEKDLISLRARLDRIHYSLNLETRFVKL